MYRVDGDFVQSPVGNIQPHFANESVVAAVDKLLGRGPRHIPHIRIKIPLDARLSVVCRPEAPNAEHLL